MAAAAIVALVSLTAAAQELVGVSLLVTHACKRPGPTDPAARAIVPFAEAHGLKSIRVLEQRHIELRMQEVGGVDLPTGKRLEVRPLSLTPTGVLLAVDLPGTLQTDVRVPNRRQVVLGMEPYDEGKLILLLQPDY